MRVAFLSCSLCLSLVCGRTPGQPPLREAALTSALHSSRLSFSSRTASQAEDFPKRKTRIQAFASFSHRDKNWIAPSENDAFFSSRTRTMITSRRVMSSCQVARSCSTKKMVYYTICFLLFKIHGSYADRKLMCTGRIKRPRKMLATE